MICHQTYNLSEELEDYVCVTPGLFFCHHHYNKYLISRHLPTNVKQKYNQRNKQNFINDLFEPKVFSEEDLNNHPPEDIYLTPEIAEDSIKLDQPFEDFVPTIELHFDKPLDDVNLNELQQFIGDYGAIIGVREGSIFIILTFLKKFGEKITNISATIKEKFSLFINKIKAKFNTSIGKDLVGNLENDQTETITFPDEEKIKELYSKPSMNMLQNTQEFNELEIDDFMYQVIEKAEKIKTKKKWLHILSKSDAFKKAEEQVRNDITNNPFEMIIVGQTLIANKHDDDYEKIK